VRRVYDWLLFLHVLAAFALVASLVVFGAIVLGTRGGTGAELLRLSPLAVALWNAGGAGTLVFGVWLTLNVDGYELWDAWIVTALVLWFIAAAAGGPLGRSLAQASAREGTSGVVAPPRAALMFSVMVAATAVLLAVMFYKPGA
jgi:hypothetical protein